MANDNPQVVLFSNERLRPAAENLVRAIRTIVQLKAEYGSKGIAALTQGSQELTDATIGDGAELDGRPVLIGYDVGQAMEAVDTLLAFLQADNNALMNKLAKPANNSTPIF